MKSLVKQPGQPLEVIDGSQPIEFQIGAYHRMPNGRWLLRRAVPKPETFTFPLWDTVDRLPKELQVELMLLNPDQQTD